MTTRRERPQRQRTIDRKITKTMFVLGGLVFLAAGIGSLAAGDDARAEELVGHVEEIGAVPGRMMVRGDQRLEAPPNNKAPEELAREGMEKMLQALDALVQSVPHYEMPVITEDGDIIIRRKRPEKPLQRRQRPGGNSGPI